MQERATGPSSWGSDVPSPSSSRNWPVPGAQHKAFTRGSVTAETSLTESSSPRRVSFLLKRLTRRRRRRRRRRHTQKAAPNIIVFFCLFSAGSHDGAGSRLWLSSYYLDAVSHLIILRVLSFHTLRFAPAFIPPRALSTTSFPFSSAAFATTCAVPLGQPRQQECSCASVPLRGVRRRHRLLTATLRF